MRNLGAPRRASRRVVITSALALGSGGAHFVREVGCAPAQESESDEDRQRFRRGIDLLVAMWPARVVLEGGLPRRGR